MKKAKMRRKRKVSSTGSNSKYSVRVPQDDIFIVLRCLLETYKDYTHPDVHEPLERAIRKRDFHAVLKVGQEFSLQRIAELAGNNSSVARATYLVASFLKKYEHPDYAPPPQTAFEKVRAGEAACQRYHYRRKRMDLEKDPVVRRVRAILALVLGEVPESDVLWNRSRHGPGTATDATFGRTSPLFKYKEWPYSVTSRGAVLARDLIWNDLRWRGALEESYRQRFVIPSWKILDWDEFFRTILVISDSNKITSVPKDAKTRRPIAIEHRLNIQLQLGIEGVIRTRLKRWGIDLNDQTQNQRLARYGSMHSDVMSGATVDLANASDTVSLGVCKDLLPREWYQLLCDVRSPFGVFPDGTKLRYRKISSMGNGTTFAVESLIFFAIAKAVTEKYLNTRVTRKVISVFGDDIILPEGAALDLTYYLETFGFEVNYEKSFMRGFVKESCGADFILGENVRPVFHRTPIKGLCDLYSLRNRLYRWNRLWFPWIEHDALDELFIKWGRNAHTRHLCPCSNTEFDTGWHVSHAPVNMWTNCGYSTRQLSSRVRRIKAERWDDFLFRKLMHQLRPLPKDKYTTSVNSFEVCDVSRKTTYEIRRRHTEWYGDEHYHDTTGSRRVVLPGRYP